MRKSIFVLLGISTLGATAPAVSQYAAVVPSLHQSGCVDFSAEYEGCLSFGPLPEGKMRVLPDDARLLHARVAISPDGSPQVPLSATISSANADHDVP